MSSATITPRMTADEFGERHSGDTVEYVGGEVRAVSTGDARHGYVCAQAAYRVGRFVDAQHLGHMFGGNTFVRVPTKDDPERVYGPDVCHIPFARLAKDAAIPNVIPLPPDLVVEVRSPSDTWALVFGKVGDYLGAGVPVVVVLDPDTRTASTYRSDVANPQRIFGSADTLTLPDVLPGFAVSVAALFV